VAHKLTRARKKVVGEPYEGKPHVRFEVAGNGNQDKISQAPFPDPTSGRADKSRPNGKRRLESDLKSRNMNRQTPVRRSRPRWAAEITDLRYKTMGLPRI